MYFNKCFASRVFEGGQKSGVVERCSSSAAPYRRPFHVLPATQLAVRKREQTETLAMRVVRESELFAMVATLSDNNPLFEY